MREKRRWKKKMNVDEFCGIFLEEDWKNGISKKVEEK
jgi:uncharacterized protein YggL (DUF469 family)